jgi:hypothetical protein
MNKKRSRKKDGTTAIEKKPTRKSCRVLVGKTASEIYRGLPMTKEGIDFAKYNVANDHPECAKYLRKKKSCRKKLYNVLKRIHF